MNEQDLNLAAEYKMMAQQLNNAGHGQKSQMAQRFAEQFGWSTATLYRKLKDFGYNSGRKRRADAGKRSVDDTTLTMIASAKYQAIRKNGKETMHTPVATSIMAQNGHSINVTNATVNRYFREDKKTNALLKADAPHVQMRSLHPNHVHQVDPSLCVLYYTPQGKQHMMEADKFYKNKLDHYNEVKLKCWRYVLTDHYSATICVRYYAAAGENSEILFDFLCYAWAKKDGFVFHGVPKQLYWDKGSANGAHSIKNFLDQLQTGFEEHGKGKARAKGSVEGGNNLVETQFECRLKLQPVNSVEELNAAVENWQNAWNADLIPHQDCRLKRGQLKEARTNLWLRIKPHELRLLPNIDICRAMRRTKPQERTVDGKLSISFVHPNIGKSAEYSLHGLQGVFKGAKVRVSAYYYSEADVRVEIDCGADKPDIHVISPIEVDDAGFNVAGPIFGEEYKRQPDTVLDQNRKEADRIAYADQTDEEIAKAKDKQKAPFGGKLNAHSYLKDAAASAPDYLPKQGETIATPDAVPLKSKTITNLKLRRLCAQHCRVAALQPHENEWLKTLGDVQEDQLQSIYQQLDDGIKPRPTLKVVNQ